MRRRTSRLLNDALSNTIKPILGKSDFELRACDARHTPRYLAAYERCYNRRFELTENLERLARVALTITPQIPQHPRRRSPKTHGSDGVIR